MALGRPAMTNDKEFLQDYYDRLTAATRLDDALVRQLTQTRDLWCAARDAGGRILFVGNGGSAAIASHLAIDLTKNARVPALCFTDAATITCLANDYGYENWMAHAVRFYGKPHDCLVAISSSGKSKNILNAVSQAAKIGLTIVTLSGMDSNNPLRSAGDVNFWVGSRAYNVVETAHQFMLMSVVDLIIGKAEYPAS
jgi:phosphoheptose isomerase